jgi:acetylornithine/N-succinyldiaminopimelate aminotransferase
MTDALDTASLMPTTARPAPVMVRGQGSHLWDDAGGRYLDFVQGWAVNCLGHCPPVVLDALQHQASRLINAGPAYHTRPQAELAAALTGAAGLDHAFFCSSGAEANEGAIKLARKWGQAQRGGAFEIITAEGSFHGRTLATMAASGKPGFDRLFPPAVPGFIKVPYGQPEAIERAIRERTVAVMLEPVQGEAGVVIPAEGYLRRVRALTEARGVLLIADEIQTGMGRTGTLFACQHEGVRPDIMTLGKGLGGGVPLAALLARREVSCFAPGDQGGTFSGHPLLTSVGLAVLRTLSQPDFLANVERSGRELRAGLSRIGAPYGARPHGRGLLCALRLPSDVGGSVVAAALQHGLLINSPQPDLLRLMPALDVSLAEIDDMLARLTLALRDALGAA